MLRMLLVLTFGAALSAATGNADVSWAQQQPTMTPPYKIIPLLRDAVTGEPNKEAIMIRVEWPPNVSTGRHTHPGDEYGTVLEGSVISQDEGGEWKTYSTGQSYHKVTGVVHETKTGDQSAITINVFFVEKGKPLAQPVQ